MRAKRLPAFTRSHQLASLESAGHDEHATRQRSTGRRDSDTAVPAVPQEPQAWWCWLTERGNHETQKRLCPENANGRIAPVGFSLVGQCTVPATQATAAAQERHLRRRTSADSKRRIAVAATEHPASGSRLHGLRPWYPAAAYRRHGYARRQRLS